MTPLRLACLSVIAAALGCRAPSEKVRNEATSARALPSSARTPAQIRREGNHLLGAASAYLRQHAHNPVDWYPWGPEALALAVRLDRPIFLSIGYVSCHWCHVMEQEVFEQDDVALFLNEHFISIKVDREERPDLDAVYMDAVQAMTGSGGWPMTSFLTPSLRPFFAGTYVPHERFLQAARAGAEQFRSDRNAVENRGAEVCERIAAREPAGLQAVPSAAELRAIAQQAISGVDPVWGGFQGRTKFPTPVKWRFLLDAQRKWGDPQVAQAVRKTLDAISAGGIRDHVGGGFFRYATEPTWTIPHFEKMLYDNAQLAALYLEAAAALDEPRYRAVALDTLDFLLADALTVQGGFGASFDADAVGREGSTYLFTPGELRSLLGDTDGRALATLLGVSDAGNFEHANVLTRRASTGNAAADAQLFERCRPTLLAARRRRPQPAFDPKMVTAWNGLAIGALALGFRASGEARFLAAAERAADAVWRLNRLASGELARASDAGRASNAAVLDDYAFLADGLVELFEATGKPLYLERARTLVTQANERFADPAGGWFLTAGASQEPLGRRVEVSDGVEPSGHALMILVLQKLAASSGREDLAALADHALARYADVLRRRGIDMAGSLEGALLASGPFYELVIAGAGSTLMHAWNGLLPSWTVGVQIDGSGAAPELAAALPTLGAKRDRDGRALAYLCVHGACQQPTSEPSTLRKQLLSGWSR